MGIKNFFAIQWLWRGNLKNEKQRAFDLINSKKEVNQFVNNIKNKLSKYFLSFPYTENFLKSTKKKIMIDGFTLYLNLEEKRYYKHIKNDNFKYITIRPFIKTNKSMRKVNLKKILRLHFKNKKILGTMISLSKREELYKIKTILNEKNF